MPLDPKILALLVLVFFLTGALSSRGRRRYRNDYDDTALPPLHLALARLTARGWHRLRGSTTQQPDRPMVAPRYTLRPSLLTTAEVRFYFALAAASEQRYILAIKPRIADVIESPSGDIAAFNRVCAKHLDYLLVDPRDMRPVAAVELNDSSHAAPKRRARDRFVREALSAAGLPLIEVSTAASYDALALRARLLSAIAPPLPHHAATSEPATPATLPHLTPVAKGSLQSRRGQL